MVKRSLILIGLLVLTGVPALAQAGGFSPGTADRVRTADGRRAFVKAVSRTINAHSVELHRREIHVTGNLPEGVAVPRLRGSYDDGEWVGGDGAGGGFTDRTLTELRRDPPPPSLGEGRPMRRIDDPR